MPAFWRVTRWLTCSKQGLSLPLWSEQILEETYRTHTGPRLSWDPRIARSFQAALLQNFPASLPSDYEHRIPQCTNQEKDRHVLACAAEEGAEVIVTYNLRDFAEKHLTPWGIRMLHPQDFLLQVHKKSPRQIRRWLEEMAKDSTFNLGREVIVEEELTALASFLPEFSRLLNALGYGKP